MKKILVLSLLIFSYFQHTNAQFTTVGSGSYRTTFPGTDAAGRNGYPSGTPQLSGNAAGKPVPTNDWWSKLVKENHADNLFTYPMALKTINQGLVVTYIPWGVMDDILPITVGTTGLNAANTTVSDYSDWTVTIDWTNGAHKFNATAGTAMPFIYFNKATTDVAQVTVASGEVTVSNEMLIIKNARNGASFAVYAPSGSTWTTSGTTYTSTLNGKNYWSMCMIPLDATDITAVANDYKKYAYVFPTSTKANFTYNQNTSVVQTDFQITTDVKEGTNTKMLTGLLPHQWSRLTASSPQPIAYKYSSVRGQIKTIEGNSFSVQNTYHGILPTLPYLNNHSQGFDPSLLASKVDAIKNDGLATWTDSYNEGQVMNRLIQVARIANETGDIESRDKILATIKNRLENWLTAQSGEVAFLFYYNSAWSTLIGYPAGHGQDNNINDHHFHWGYFIHAASFLEQFQPGWANQWGDMINLLVRDAASTDRNDTMFPFLRNFSPYSGHCWANGFASFPQGNDQESTSESMQFNSSLIHWGTITGNTAIRDLGIYLYTTEQSAIEEYWFDMNNRNFKPEQRYSLVSRVWGNSYDNQTFWTGDIAAAYGIEMYPIHGGSLYLGQNIAYATKLWNEIKQNTGIMNNEANPNLWHDLMWEYLAFTDPQAAINLYDSYPNRELKFGVADAQTYYWLHSMNAMGQVDASITATYPIAAAFKKGSDITYVAHNYGNTPLTVTFSDGYVLQVAARSMGNSKSANVAGELKSSFKEAFANGSVTLELNITQGNPTNVEFYDGSQKIGQLSAAPFRLDATNLALGKHKFYAKIYDGTNYNISSIVPVVVGQQLPLESTPWAIPGTIEPGKYDIFEGGVGQDVSYFDVSQNNEGDYRKSEYVDASMHPSEGAIITNNASGEWLEYTINVASSGLYSLACRYASGNTAGGGPFYLELDGKKIADNIKVTSTSSTSWDVWSTKTVTNIPLIEGKHTLRLTFEDGEVNLGKMTFARTGNLAYSQPVAKVGNNIKVLLPATTTTLNGSASVEPTSQALTYQWEQVYGPSLIAFDNNQAVSPTVSNLKEGIYKVKLTVKNSALYSDAQEQLIIVSSTSNVLPTISITSPVDKASYIENTSINIVANANDLDGTVTSVEFYNGATKIGTSTTAPYNVYWTSVAGDYNLTAKVIDNDGGQSISQAVKVTFTPAPSCEGFADNGDFSFVFSEDKNNPTVTFVPQKANIGTSTCILYYGTSAGGPFPGMLATANVPFRITAAQGTKIYFYYTYSTPTGEQNTAANKHSYVVGSCQNAPAVPDAVKPVMGAASVVNKASTSALLALAATDVNDNSQATVVTAFILNDAANGIVNKAIEINATGQFNLMGLTPSTTYNLTVTAKDNAGNISANSTILTFTTEAPDPSSLLIDDFEGVDKGWETVDTGIAVVANPDKTGSNTSNKVLEIIRGATQGNFWAGSILRNVNKPKNYKYLHVRMHRNNMHKPILKISDAGPEFLARPMPNITIVENQWQDVVFDISATEHNVDFVFIMPDETSGAVGSEVKVYIDDVILNNDPTPRGGTTPPVTDAVKPVMGAASVVSKSSTSAILSLAATDVNDNSVATEVITFIINDAANGIANKEVMKNGEGKFVLSGLTPSISYNLTIAAKDKAGNVSANSTALTFTTEQGALGLLVDDFESGDKGWAVVNDFFELIANPYKTGLNESNNVLHIVRDASQTAFWTGAILDPAGGSNEFKYVHIKMHRNNTNMPKLKISDNPPFEVLPMSNIVIEANKWQDVVFDITEGPAVSFILLMADVTDGAIGEEVNVYIDDILLNNDPTPRTATGVQVTDGYQITMLDKTIVITGLANEKIYAYGLNGLLAASTKGVDGKASITLPQGVYVLKIGNSKGIKIFVK